MARLSLKALWRKVTSPAPRAADVFVNYRRADSAGHTGRLSEQLNSRLIGQVFMDLDAIAPGVNFVDRIEQSVGSCDVLIAVIGDEWLTVADAAGRRRLEDPEDFVRLELATALRNGTMVIPVLVEGASMPRAADLPPDLAMLSRQNPLELSNRRWDDDVESLLETIEDRFPGSVTQPPSRGWRHVLRNLSGPLMALAVGVPVSLLLAVLLPFQMRPRVVLLSAFSIALWVLAAVGVEFYGVGLVLPVVVKKRFTRVLIAAGLGLVAFVVLREILTETVPVGSHTENVLIGFGRHDSPPRCPCPESWDNRECLLGHLDETTIQECWGSLKLERLLLWVAYLTPSAGLGGLLGLIGLHRKARERTKRQRRAKEKAAAA